MVATVAPPSVLPIMTVIRGTGATSVSFKKPNCRSHSRPMPEKIGCEQHGHSDHTGCDKLNVAALARPAETPVRVRNRARADRASGCPSEARTIARERM